MLLATQIKRHALHDVAQSPQRDSQRPLLCTPRVQVAGFRGMLRPIERPAQCTAFLIQGPLPAVFCLQLALLQSCSPEPQQSALTAALSVACQPAARLGQAAFSRSQVLSACSTCLPAPVRMTTSSGFVDRTCSKHKDHFTLMIELAA